MTDVGAGRLARMYADGQRRVAGLVAALPGDRAKEVATPACPGWSVHDVVAHLAGVADDITAGRLDGVATDRWTAAQVEPRRDVATIEVLAEWQTVTTSFAGALDTFPGWFGAQAVMDLTVHEQDVRGALGVPGYRDSAGLATGLDMLLCAVLHPVACSLGLPALEVRAGADSWTLGGEPSVDRMDGDPVAAALMAGSRPRHAILPEATLAATPYELFRAATGRRSEAQIRGYEWSVDPTPYLELFSCGPFAVRETDLVE